MVRRSIGCLDRLKSDPASAQGIEAAVYRLLCLVALDRQAQAQEVIESIVQSDPLYTPTDDSVASRDRVVPTGQTEAAADDHPPGICERRGGGR